MSGDLLECKSLLGTRAEALASGSARYFTGKPCSRGHVASRYTAARACAECSKAATVAWQSRNLETVRAKRRDHNKAYYLKNADVLREKNNTYNAANREKRAEAERNRRLSKAEEIRAKDRARYAADPDGRKIHIRNWQLANPHKLASYNARRRAAELQATPSWLTSAQLDEIAEKYREAAELTAATGIEHHVDHIFPLRGKNFCGLHVPWNLQVLPAPENLAKGNKPPSHAHVFA
jgi:hypothetical protein